MRVKFIATMLLVALVAFLLGPSSGQSQWRGGSGGPDPDRMFEMLSQGGSTVKIANMQWGRDQAQEWAQKNGVTNGEFTRDQFRTYLSESMRRSFDPEESFKRYSRDGKTVQMADTRSPERVAAWAKEQGITGDSLTKEQWTEYIKSFTSGRRDERSPSTSTPSSAADPKSESKPEDRGRSGRGWGDRGFDLQRVDERFRWMDRNGDGFLQVEEMSETLAAERDKWDANKDGLIDINEFREYMKAWYEKRQAERGESSSSDPRGASDARGNLPPGSHGDEVPAVDLDKKVVVLRAGKLGDKMPAWFNDYDLDKDAQVALYEWKEKGGDLAEFRKWDLNGDGFITPDEVLRVTALGGKDPSSGIASASPSDRPAGPASPPSPGGTATAGNRIGDWLSSRFGRSQTPGGSPGGLGGPPGGRSFGGMGGSPKSADQRFDELAKDRSSFNINELPQMFRGSLADFAQKKGITDGQITRELYKEYSAQREAERAVTEPAALADGPGVAVPVADAENSTPAGLATQGGRGRRGRTDLG